MTNSKEGFLQSFPAEACYSQGCSGNLLSKDLIHYQPMLNGRSFGEKVWCIVRDCPICGLHMKTPVNYTP